MSRNPDRTEPSPLLASLFAFSRSMGWRVRHRADGRWVLVKRGMPAIYVGVRPCHNLRTYGVSHD